MAHINLLPWREQRRLKQKQQYLMVLGLVALITFLIFWLIGQFVDQQISNQNARNQYLTAEIAALESQIAEIKKIKESKAAIEQRMALIEQLQSSRNLAPQVLDELARIVPQGVSFKSLQRTGGVMQVRGTSESNNRLAEFMRQLETSEVFTSGELSSIVADTSASDAVSEFTLTFSIRAQVVSAEQDKSRVNQ